MVIKPFAAFGCILTRNTYADGEVFISIVPENTPFTNFWAKGLFKTRNLATGEQERDLPAGSFVGLADSVPGTFEHTAVGETEVFCYDVNLNNGKPFFFTPFSLEGGAESLLPVGTKLFLCSGVLAVNGKNVDKPMQITVSSKNTLVTAVTDCHGLALL